MLCVFTALSLSISISYMPTLWDYQQFGVSVWQNGRLLKSATRTDASSDRKSSEADHPKLTLIQIRGQILKNHTLTMTLQKCWVHGLQVKPTQGQRQRPPASFVRGLIKPLYKRFSLVTPWLLQQILQHWESLPSPLAITGLPSDQVRIMKTQVSFAEEAAC